jgi:hypothetical protein
MVAAANRGGSANLVSIPPGLKLDLIVNTPFGYGK